MSSPFGEESWATNVETVQQGGNGNGGSRGSGSNGGGSGSSGGGGGGGGGGSSTAEGGGGSCGGVREERETKEGGTSSFTSTGGSAFDPSHWVRVEEGPARRGSGGNGGSGSSGGGSRAGGGEEVRLGKVETEEEDSFSLFGPMSSYSSTIETFELSNTTPLRPRQHRARRNTTARAMDDSADGGDVEDGADDSGWGASISDMMSESSAPKRSQQYITNKLLTEGKVGPKWREAAARTLARGACGKSTTYA